MCVMEVLGFLWPAAEGCGRIRFLLPRQPSDGAAEPIDLASSRW
jgi:hypothetical protein